MSGSDESCCGDTPGAPVSRRQFLALSAGGIAAVAGASPADARPIGRPIAVPPDKGTPATALRQLTERGSPTRYRGDALRYIGMPVGGITAGQLYLGGDGRLWWWDIDNPQRPPVAGTDFAGTHYAEPVSYLDTAVYRPPFRQGFALRTTAASHRRTRALDSTGFPASDITFTGQYPVGRVDYPPADGGVRVRLEAFSPFVPLATDDSALPATVLVYTLTNVTTAPVDAVLAGFAESPVCLDSRTQQPIMLRGAAVGTGATEFTAAAGPVGDRPDIVFEDFESDTYEGWTVTGTAFGPGPVTEAELPDYMKRFGPLNVHGTRFVTSHDFRGPAEDPDSETGTLTSPTFTVQRRYVTVSVGGGALPDETCVNAVVDGVVVASVSGGNIEPMSVRALDLRHHQGKTAHLEIVDDATGAWGHVNVDNIVFTDNPASARPLDQLPDHGSVVLAGLDGAAVAVPSLARADTLDDIFDAGPGPLEVDAADGTITGAVRVPLRLSPGETRTVRFALCWYFPVPRRELFARLADAATLTHHYATRFGGAADVLTYLARHRHRLEEDTRAFVDTWYTDSTLPHWFLERTLAPASTLATTTCYRFDSGRFYAFEGLYCCDGTCEHVWNYAQSVARLFPALERDTRERVDLGIALHTDTGAMDYRAEYDQRVATDGQCGTILRVYREHQMAPDSAFLRANWDRIRLAVRYLIGADQDDDGVLEGEQYNTLDQSWWGEIPWISGLYVAALRAAAAMAREMDDARFASRCDRLAESGAAYLSTRLWNDEYGYFVQRLDPDHQATNSNLGCYADQMYGQTYAHQLGLPRVFPADKARTALRNLYRYNFLPDTLDYRTSSPIGDEGRVFAEHAEPGLLLCTWPYGGGQDAPGGGNPSSVAYFNEVWTGLEYQVAAHLFAEGLTEQGLLVTRAVYQRYQATRRNPYNEIECSDHYTRAMMSHAVYLAATGYEHHGPRGHLGFAPRFGAEDFRCGFTASQGWGSYEQMREGRRFRARIRLRYGTLRLSTLAVQSPYPPRKVRATLDGRPVAVDVTSEGSRVLLRLEAPMTVHKGQILELGLVPR
ncbi:MAG: GH116 family glycosyl hydrolase [Actinocatenispora sp.]